MEKLMERISLSFRKPLDSAVTHALAHLESLDQSPVGATVDLRTLRERLRKPLTDDGVPPEQVIHDLVRDEEGGILGSAGGRSSWQTSEEDVARVVRAVKNVLSA